MSNLVLHYIIGHTCTSYSNKQENLTHNKRDCKEYIIMKVKILRIMPILLDVIILKRHLSLLCSVLA